MIPTDRRGLIRGGLSLSALTLLTGCDPSDSDPVQDVLGAFSRWNDRVQAALFSPTRLAPTFPERLAVKDFRYNAWYGPDKAPRLDDGSYRLQLAGLIADKRPWTVEQLHALPQETQITRHVCVEGWSMIGKWTGTPLRVFLERIGADTTAKYVGFECADGYYEGMDMPTRPASADHHGVQAVRRNTAGSSTAILSRSAFPPNSGSRTRNSSRPFTLRTSSRAGSGRIADTTGSAGSEAWGKRTARPSRRSR